MDANRVLELRIIAEKIRRHIIEGTYHAQCGHPGGSMSIADILSVLYFEKMNIDPCRPKWEDRDRFILSKGHCAPGYYGALAERGFFPKEEIKKLRQADSFLQGHPDAKTTPGVDACSGSLGQGLSIAVGMGIAAKKIDKSYRIYVILGDGEIEEGQIWEAAMSAAHYALDNITAFIDFNNMQIDGYIKDVMSPLPIDDKFKAFGWNVIICDGHDCSQLLDAINKSIQTEGKPSLIIMKTIKGKGVSFMENSLAWHGIAPDKEQYEQAMAELNNSIEEMEREII